MPTFAELLTQYMIRTGISDTELARSVGVRRQTIFRWKEGIVTRPRAAEDVLRCAERLRLSPAERDTLLIAARFPPLESGFPTAESPAIPATSAPPQRPPAAPSAGLPGTSKGWIGGNPAMGWLLALTIALFLAGSAIVAIQWRRGRAYPVAEPGQTLVVVGQFTNYAGGEQGYNVAGRLQATLEAELATAGLSTVRAAVWPEEIRDRTAAQAVSQRSGAKLVIWGEYDSGRVLARFAAPELTSAADAREIEKQTLSPGDLPATINDALPNEVRYVALLTLGQLYTDRGQYASAGALLAQAAAHPPSDRNAQASLFFLQGYVHQLGEPPDLDQAIAAYTRAATLRPEMISAYNNRGIAYLHRGRSGDHARALADLNRVLAADPGAAAAYANRGVAYLQLDGLEHTTLAISDFDQAISLDPDMVAAYFNRGLAYVRQGIPAHWLPDFEHVLAAEADHAGVHNALCWAYALDQQPGLALPYCERAVVLDTGGDAHDSRGIVYAELGRLEDAISDFETYLAALRTRGDAAYASAGPAREAWIEQLSAGRNPFDQTTLAGLQTQ